METLLWNSSRILHHTQNLISVSSAIKFLGSACLEQGLALITNLSVGWEFIGRREYTAREICAVRLFYKSARPRSPGPGKIRFSGNLSSRGWLTGAPAALTYSFSLAQSGPYRFSRKLGRFIDGERGGKKSATCAPSTRTPPRCKCAEPSSPRGRFIRRRISAGFESCGPSFCFHHPFPLHLFRLRTANATVHRGFCGPSRLNKGLFVVERVVERCYLTFRERVAIRSEQWRRNMVSEVTNEPKFVSMCRGIRLNPFPEVSDNRRGKNVILIWRRRSPINLSESKERSIWEFFLKEQWKFFVLGFHWLISLSFENTWDFFHFEIAKIVEIM